LDSTFEEQTVSTAERIAQLEHRTVRLEEAILLVGSTLTIRRGDGTLEWPFPEFDTLTPDERARRDATVEAHSARLQRWPEEAAEFRRIRSQDGPRAAEAYREERLRVHASGQ